MKNIKLMGLVLLPSGVKIRFT